MKFINISTKICAIILLTITLALVGFKSTLTYKADYNRYNEYSNEIVADSCFIDKNPMAVNFQEDFSRFLQKSKLDKEKLYINRISISMDDSTSNIKNFSTNHYLYDNNSYKVAWASEYINNEGNIMTSLHIDNHPIRLPRPEMFKNDKSLQLISKLFENGFEGVIDKKISSMHIEIVDYSENGIDYSLFKSYTGNNGNYRDYTPKYWEYTQDKLHLIEDIESFITTEPSYLYEMYISSEDANNNFWIIVH